MRPGAGAAGISSTLAWPPTQSVVWPARQGASGLPGMGCTFQPGRSISSIHSVTTTAVVMARITRRWRRVVGR